MKYAYQGILAENDDITLFKTVSLNSNFVLGN